VTLQGLSVHFAVLSTPSEQLDVPLSV
jgi:hypothetical protein